VEFDKKRKMYGKLTNRKMDREKMKKSLKGENP